MENKGYIHVYTGNGKGKTTAALGLSVRAVCAGKSVFMGQFIKGMEYSELKAMNYLPNFTIKQYGKECFIYRDPKKEDLEFAKRGLLEIKGIINSGKYDIIILDELNIALHYNMFSTEDVLEILENRPKNVEIIITGRYAKDEILEKADLITEMKAVKHYYKSGVKARLGIEK